MDQIALLKSEQVFPFINYMQSAGMPVAKYLGQARLPLSLLDHADGLIIEKQLWQLLDNVSRQENLSDFGLRVGHEIDIQQLLKGMMPRLMAQPTLLDLIQAFCQMVNEESSDAQFWLVPSDTPDRHWFCRGGVPGIAVGEREAEHYTLVLMIKLIQLLTGPDWHPDHLQLKTDDHLGLDQWSLFNSCEIKFQQNMTAIEIPPYVINKHFFVELKKINYSGSHSHLTHSVDISHSPLSTNSLSESLREVLSLYMGDDKFNLNNAAKLLGVSVRTLQRQLSQEQTSYAELIDLIRFDSAIPLLRDQNNKLVNIAYDLGYSDPAHFSRAFKRWAGVSPREYRRNLVA